MGTGGDPIKHCAKCSVLKNVSFHFETLGPPMFDISWKGGCGFLCFLDCFIYMFSKSHLCVQPDSQVLYGFFRHDRGILYGWLILSSWFSVGVPPFQSLVGGVCISTGHQVSRVTCLLHSLNRSPFLLSQPLLHRQLIRLMLQPDGRISWRSPS